MLGYKEGEIEGAMKSVVLQIAVIVIVGIVSSGWSCVCVDINESPASESYRSDFGTIDDDTDSPADDDTASPTDDDSINDDLADDDSTNDDSVDDDSIDDDTSSDDDSAE